MIESKFIRACSMCCMDSPPGICVDERRSFVQWNEIFKCELCGGEFWGTSWWVPRYHDFVLKKLSIREELLEAQQL